MRITKRKGGIWGAKILPGKALLPVSAGSALSISSVSLAAGIFDVTVTATAQIYYLISASAAQMTGVAIKAAVLAASPVIYGNFAAGIGATSQSITMTPLSAGDWYLHVAADNGTVFAAAPFIFTYVPPATNSVRQTSSGSDQTFNTACDVTLPGAITAGSNLLLLMSFGATRTITPPGGWTQIGSYIPAADGGQIAAFKKTTLAAGTEGGASLSFTADAAVNNSWIFYELGLAVGSIEITGNTTSGGDPDALTPSGGNREYIWIAATHTIGTQVTTPTIAAAPATYGNLTTAQSDPTTNGSSGHRTVASAHKIATAASDDPSAFSAPGWAAERRNAITIAAW